jgi:hypothetical protein
MQAAELVGVDEHPVDAGRLATRLSGAIIESGVSGIRI